VSACVRIACNADRCNSHRRSVCPCPSVRHTPVFCPDEWRYDRVFSSIRYDNYYSSFWRGKDYPDIRRELPPARALKWSDPMSLAELLVLLETGLSVAQSGRQWFCCCKRNTQRKSSSAVTVLTSRVVSIIIFIIFITCFHVTSSNSNMSSSRVFSVQKLWITSSFSEHLFYLYDDAFNSWHKVSLVNTHQNETTSRLDAWSFTANRRLVYATFAERLLDFLNKFNDNWCRRYLTVDLWMSNAGHFSV